MKTEQQDERLSGGRLLGEGHELKLNPESTHGEQLHHVAGVLEIEFANSLDRITNQGKVMAEVQSAIAARDKFDPTRFSEEEGKAAEIESKSYADAIALAQLEMGSELNGAKNTLKEAADTVRESVETSKKHYESQSNRSRQSSEADQDRIEETKGGDLDRLEKSIDSAEKEVAGQDLAISKLRSLLNNAPVELGSGKLSISMWIAGALSMVLLLGIHLQIYFESNETVLLALSGQFCILGLLGSLAFYIGKRMKETRFPKAPESQTEISNESYPESGEETYDYRSRSEYSVKPVYWVWIAAVFAGMIVANLLLALFEVYAAGTGRLILVSGLAQGLAMVELAILGFIVSSGGRVGQLREELRLELKAQRMLKKRIQILTGKRSTILKEARRASGAVEKDAAVRLRRNTLDFGGEIEALFKQMGLALKGLDGFRDRSLEALARARSIEKQRIDASSNHESGDKIESLDVLLRNALSVLCGLFEAAKIQTLKSYQEARSFVSTHGAEVRRVKRAVDQGLVGLCAKSINAPSANSEDLESGVWNFTKQDEFERRLDERIADRIRVLHRLALKPETRAIISEFYSKTNGLAEN